MDKPQSNEGQEKSQPAVSEQEGIPQVEQPSTVVPPAGQKPQEELPELPEVEVDIPSAHETKPLEETPITVQEPVRVIKEGDVGKNPVVDTAEASDLQEALGTNGQE